MDREDLSEKDCLPREFYDRDTLEVAEDLLGCILVREYEGVKLAGRITEVEAYIGRIKRAVPIIIGGQLAQRRCLRGRGWLMFI